MTLTTLVSFLGSVLSFILVIVPIIWIHELGHFLVGKWLGAKPEVFSIGFGKKVFSFKFMDSDWQIAAIPLGGFVKFKKQQFQFERDLLGVEDDAPLSSWKWILISFAGPASNIILAFFIALGLCYHELRLVTAANSFAGKFFIVQNPEDSMLLKKLCATKCPYAIQYREGKYKSFSATEYALLNLDVTPTTLSIAEKLVYGSAISTTILIAITESSLGGLFAVFTTPDGYKDLSGPVGIASLSNQARSIGPAAFLSMIAMMSLSVGIFNLLPLSILDGGRILLGAIELVIRKPVSARFMNGFQYIGLALLILLLSGGLLSDITQIIM